MSRIVVLHLTHYLTNGLIRRWRALQSECCELGHDHVLLFDRGHHPAPEIPGVAVHGFNLASVKSLGFPMASLQEQPPAIVPGHADFPLLEFFEAHPHYDYYWLIEHDVRFSGNWSPFFRACDTSRADLLATHIQRFPEHQRWHWWSSLKFKGQPIRRDDMVRAFFPIYRLSNPACRMLVDEYRKGWEGHFEARLATILSVSGCALEDIGGDGAFVPEGHKNRFYFGMNSLSGREATFRWRPAMKRPGDIPGMLWHPVKVRIPAEPESRDPAQACRGG
jgi:hypothetical protein